MRFGPFNHGPWELGYCKYYMCMYYIILKGRSLLFDLISNSGYCGLFGHFSNGRTPLIPLLYLTFNIYNLTFRSNVFPTKKKMLLYSQVTTNFSLFILFPVLHALNHKVNSDWSIINSNYYFSPCQYMVAEKI